MRFSDLLGEPEEPAPRPPEQSGRPEVPGQSGRSATGGHVEPSVTDASAPAASAPAPEDEDPLGFLVPVSDDLLPTRRGRGRAQPSGSTGRS